MTRHNPCTYNLLRIMNELGIPAASHETIILEPIIVGKRFDLGL